MVRRFLSAVLAAPVLLAPPVTSATKHKTIAAAPVTKPESAGDRDPRTAQ